MNKKGALHFKRGEKVKSCRHESGKEKKEVERDFYSLQL